MNMKMDLTRILFVATTVICVAAGDEDKTVENENYGVKYASPCEGKLLLHVDQWQVELQLTRILSAVCKFLAIELTDRLDETSKTHEVLETGYHFDPSRKMKTRYVKSELRLVESLDNVCERLLKYNVHKERTDSTRFAKGQSQTFETLHGLVDKGVKVDLGIPYDLWDKPSAEVTHLKTQCENMLEKHEEDIENWYWTDQDTPLYKYICIDRALKKGDAGCLDETLANDKTLHKEIPAWEKKSHEDEEL